MVDDEIGVFGPATAASVRSFQRQRGLGDDGCCGEGTWRAIVEASFRLGDRHLKLVAPHLRGDDVDALQTRLARLGFDCGRVDGVFGPCTARALIEFQRNCGAVVDGVCGPQTIRAMEINSARSGSGPGVAVIRELEQLGEVARSLDQLRLVVGDLGGLGPLSRQVTLSLRQRGANVITVDELLPAAHAAMSNRHEASAYVGFEPHVDETAGVAYYSTPGFESAGGRALARNLANELSRAGVGPVSTDGRRLEVLRETRMTAVVCSLGPVQRIVDTAAVISDAVVDAIASWVAAPARVPA